MLCAILLYIESMHTLRHRVALRTIGRRFGFIVTKDVLQLLRNFIFETSGLDRNGVSQVVQRYQIPFRQELSQWSALACPEVRRA